MKIWHGDNARSVGLVTVAFWKSGQFNNVLDQDVVFFCDACSRVREETGESKGHPGRQYRIAVVAQGTKLEEVKLLSEDDLVSNNTRVEEDATIQRSGCCLSCITSLTV